MNATRREGPPTNISQPTFTRDKGIRYRNSLFTMKEELIDEGYDSAEWSSLKRGRDAEDDEAVMVAKRIKEEMGIEEEEEKEERLMRTEGHSVIIRRRDSTPRVPAPIAYDHFICMRIGLNSEYNVQRLMALLTAHNFVDLTVMPGNSMMPPPVLVPNPRPIMVGEPSTSQRHLDALFRRDPLAPKPAKKYAPRRVHGDPLQPAINTMMKCMKCGEIMGSGSTANHLLSHVQKIHLKMAAFQCRICKHYRTTQERIQSHVTTVHKARSTSFDDTLAGKISDTDMLLMEKMITACFPQINCKLEITDRLNVKSYSLSNNSTIRKA